MALQTEIRGSKNLGLIKAIHVGVNPPLNKRILWFDDSNSIKIHKYYNFQQALWLPLNNDGDITVNGTYTYIAFSSDCNGADFSLEFNELIHKFTSIISSDVQIDDADIILSLFENKWLRFCGGDASGGNYTYLGFADNCNGDNFGTEPNYESIYPECSFVDSYAAMNNSGPGSQTYSVTPSNGGVNLDFNLTPNGSIVLALKKDGEELMSEIEYCIQIDVPPTLAGKFYVRLDDNEVGGYGVILDGSAKTFKFKKLNRSSNITIEFFDQVGNSTDSIFLKVGDSSCCDEPSDPETPCLKSRKCFAMITSADPIAEEDIDATLFEDKWFCFCPENNSSSDIKNIKQLIYNLFGNQLTFEGYVEQEIVDILNLIINLTATVEQNQIDMTSIVNNNYNTIISIINDLQLQVNSIISTQNIQGLEITILQNQFIDLLEQFNSLQQSVFTELERYQVLLDTQEINFSWKKSNDTYTKQKTDITAGVQTSDIFNRNGFLTNGQPTVSAFGTLIYPEELVDYEVSEVRNLIVNFNDEKFQKLLDVGGVKVVISRYKDTKYKRKVEIGVGSGEFNKKYRKSGYRSSQSNLSFKPNKIELTNSSNILDIGQEHYFTLPLKYSTGEVSWITKIHPRGLGGRFRTNVKLDGSLKKAWVWLEMKLELTVGVTVMTSKSLGRVKMILSIESIETPISTEKSLITFKES